MKMQHINAVEMLESLSFFMSESVYSHFFQLQEGVKEDFLIFSTDKM